MADKPSIRWQFQISVFVNYLLIGRINVEYFHGFPCVAHVPGMPGTFPPPPRVSDPDMHRGTCVTHVPWCLPGSLTSGFLWSRWRRKRSRHSQRMRNLQFYVSGKRPMLVPYTCLLSTFTGSLSDLEWKMAGHIRSRWSTAQRKQFRHVFFQVSRAINDPILWSG